MVSGKMGDLGDLRIAIPSVCLGSPGKDEVCYVMQANMNEV